MHICFGLCNCIFSKPLKSLNWKETQRCCSEVERRVSVTPVGCLGLLVSVLRVLYSQHTQMDLDRLAHRRQLLHVGQLLRLLRPIGAHVKPHLLTPQGLLLTWWTHSFKVQLTVLHFNLKCLNSPAHILNFLLTFKLNIKSLTGMIAHWLLS